MYVCMYLYIAVSTRTLPPVQHMSRRRQLQLRPGKNRSGLQVENPRADSVPNRKAKARQRQRGRGLEGAHPIRSDSDMSDSDMASKLFTFTFTFTPQMTHPFHDPRNALDVGCALQLRVYVALHPGVFWRRPGIWNRQTPVAASQSF